MKIVRPPRALAALCLLSLPASAQVLQPGDVQTIGARTAVAAAIHGGDPRTPISPATTPGDADSTFRIAKPGSYYLTGNLLGAAGKAGIEVAVADVEIDLSGFQLKGVTGSLAAVRGAGVAVRNVTVRRGTIVDWAGSAIDLATADDVRVLDVTAFGNDGRGIHARHQAWIERCIVRANELNGIEIGEGGAVLASSSSVNGDDGVVTGVGTVVRGVVADQNTLRGFRVGSGSVIEACVATRNGFNGVQGGARTTVRGCTATDNEDKGIHVSSGLVVDCTSARNGSDGISCDGNSLIRGNLLEENDGNGVFVAGNQARIDSNQISRHQEPFAAAVRLTGEHCVVVRNTCVDNTTFVSTNGDDHFVGPIVDFSSSSAPSSNPWSNFVD